MERIIYYLLLVIMLVSAVFAVVSRNLLNSVISLSIFSGSLVILFVILQAPDVALAEAVVAAGVSTGFIVVTISKTEGVE